MMSKSFYFWGGVVIGSAPEMFINYRLCGLIPAFVIGAIMVTVWSIEKNFKGSWK